jgi:hypothetical protein
MTCKIGSSSCASKREGVAWPGDDAVELCWQWRYQVSFGRDVMSLLSHAGDDAVELC